MKVVVLCCMEGDDDSFACGHIPSSLRLCDADLFFSPWVTCCLLPSFAFYLISLFDLSNAYSND